MFRYRHVHSSICMLTVFDVFLCWHAMFLHLTLVFPAGVFILAHESLFCSVANLGEEKEDGREWLENERIGGGNRDFAPLPLPCSSSYLFLFSINFSFITRYSQPIHVFGDALASSELGQDSRILGWSWVGVSSKGGVGRCIPRILDWSNQNPQLQNL